mmetsp:Transcript_17705/g.30757  ORF Transcript_17705/g.30757 Transcript_17705/m.30757 type:complete len:208 (-) Transcript_17705:376-999(-)
MIGKFRPRCKLTVASSWIPTSKKSPISFAALNVSIWPQWNISNAPSIYTTLSPAFRARAPPENCSSLLVVGKNVDTRVNGWLTLDPAASDKTVSPLSDDDARRGSGTLAGESSLSCDGDASPFMLELSPFSTGCPSKWWLRVQSNILPTISVEETPSVLLMVLNLPAVFTAAYASFPSAPIQGSSPCTMKSILYSLMSLSKKPSLTS